MQIKGIIFDFDGTIVSQEIDFKNIFLEIQDLLQSHKLKKPEKNQPILEYLKQVERTNREKCESFLKEAHTLLLEKEKLASKNAKPIKGVCDFLDRLKNERILIGIVTRNSRFVVEEILKEKGISYDFLLAREDVPKVKPHPTHIGTMIKKMSLKKNQVLVAGDHPMDIIAAKRTGVLSCGVLSGGRTREDFIKVGADFVYDDITGLKFILGLEKLPDGKIENQLLRYLLRKYCVCDGNVILGPGIGIDAAVVKTRSKLIALKTDPITLVSKNIGTYAVIINANDIVCSGSIPGWLITGIIFPQGTRFPLIEEVFRDISRTCRKLKISWVGGHTEISDSVSQVIVSGFLAGEKMKNIKQIESIKDGDALVLVKQVGIEGASILARERKELSEKFPEVVKRAMKATEKPGISVVKEAMLAWKTVPVIRMHDPTEGGIASGITELAENMGCGFVIEEQKISFYEPAKIFSQHLGIDIYRLISSGCLLVVVPVKYAKKLVSAYRKHRIPASVIGHTTKDRRILLKRDNVSIDLKSSSTDEILKVS